MGTNALLCAERGEKRISSKLKRRETRAFPGDDLASVLFNLDQRLLTQGKLNGGQQSDGEATEIAKLRADFAALKAENERLAEKVSDDLEVLADRVSELEALALWPWWRRAFGCVTDGGKKAGKSRGKAVARLRALSSIGDG